MEKHDTDYLDNDGQIADPEAMEHEGAPYKGRIEQTADSVVIHLDDALTFKASKLDDERTVAALTLPRRVKGKHLRAMDKVEGEISKSMALLAKMAGVPLAALDELDGRDFELCMTAIEPFLPKRQATGPR